jgi:hypothetical protein
MYLETSEKHTRNKADIHGLLLISRQRMKKVPNCQVVLLYCKFRVGIRYRFLVSRHFVE